jgi:hypothetical protein
MATITPTGPTRLQDGGVFDVYITTWALGNADTGVAVAMASAADRSVQISGTFGAATIVVEGSNDGVTWFTLTDPQGNGISATTARFEQIEEVSRFIRCSSSGGTGTAITVTLLTRGQR